MRLLERMWRGLRVVGLTDEPRHPAPTEPPSGEVPLGVLERTVGRGARHDLLLRLAADLHARADGRVVLNVGVSDEYGHHERLLLDPLRRALRYAGVPLAEPGERLDRDGHRVMHFFSEEDLADELWLAGLEIESRQGTRFIVRPCGSRRGARSATDPRPMVRRVLAVLPKIEWQLRNRSPQELFAFARTLGRRARPVHDRAAHRHAIAWVDGLVPGAKGCYRRTALELATSPEAAEEDVLLGLDVGRTGHAWLASDPRARLYDVTFRLAP